MKAHMDDIVLVRSEFDNNAKNSKMPFARKNIDKNFKLQKSKN